MLDIKFIRENPELVQKATNEKNFPVDISLLLKIDDGLKSAKARWERLQSQRNDYSKQSGKASPEERGRIRVEVLKIKDKINELTQEIRSSEASLRDLMLKVAQPAREDVPVGKDDKENVEIRKWGQPPKFNFSPKDHLTIGEQLDIIDIPRGVKLSGSRSYIFRGDGTLLEQALLRYGYDLLVKKGFTPMSVPVLVNHTAMEGTGYFPMGREQAYCIEKDKMALVGTGEVSLCGLHGNEFMTLEQLPVRYLTQTTCFRREAGTYGKDTHGLYRVHQFQKIEMVIIAPNDKELTDRLHDELLGLAEGLLQELELPYRIVYVCSGDLGQGQVRKHDIETWMPSRSGYGETHSCSSFYDFQARRLNIKYKDRDHKKHYVYTLNNTLLAAPRIILALLENHQTSNGRIRVPPCLRPYLNGREYLGDQT